jgi:hypothetical protein
MRKSGRVVVGAVAVASAFILAFRVHALTRAFSCRSLGHGAADIWTPADALYGEFYFRKRPYETTGGHNRTH